jgi:hypothetical protein
MGNSPHLDWTVIDPDSGESIAECDASVPDSQEANIWTTSAGSKGITLWAASKTETWVYEMTAETEGFEEIHRLPVGTDNSVGRGSGIDLMADEENVYFSDLENKPLIFTKEEVGEAFDELSGSVYVTFSPDLRSVVSISDTTLSVWEAGSGAWQKLWSRPVGAAASAMPVVSVDGAYVFVGLQSGEFAVWSIARGERLSAISFNPHLQGAHFSGQGDLEDLERDSILLAGGSVEE